MPIPPIFWRLFDGLENSVNTKALKFEIIGNYVASPIYNDYVTYRLAPGVPD
jgi:hypothetical protein